MLPVINNEEVNAAGEILVKLAENNFITLRSGIRAGMNIEKKTGLFIHEIIDLIKVKKLTTELAAIIFNEFAAAGGAKDFDVLDHNIGLHRLNIIVSNMLIALLAGNRKVPADQAEVAPTEPTPTVSG